jgi:hypothetical protein
MQSEVMDRHVAELLAMTVGLFMESAAWQSRKSGATDYRTALDQE